jgi:hypothetical protein|tara:strand:- start:1090 stop:1227 length:138 start_codon:yes stop_codon:yes gene_type:complete
VERKFKIFADSSTLSMKVSLPEPAKYIIDIYLNETGWTRGARLLN